MINKEDKTGCQKGREYRCDNPFPCVVCDDYEIKPNIGNMENFHIERCSFYQGPNQPCLGHDYGFKYDHCGFCPVRRKDIPKPKKKSTARRCFNYNPNKAKCNKCMRKKIRPQKSCYVYYKHPKYERMARQHQKKPATIPNQIATQKSMKAWTPDKYKKMYGDE